MVDGRGPNRTDDLEAPLVAVVNQTLAERLWPGQTALGRTVVLDDLPRTVVGVAQNAVYYEIGEAPQMQLFVPQLQDYAPFFDFVIATTGSPEGIAHGVIETIQSYDASIPIHRSASLENYVHAKLGEYRVTAVLATLFAGIAVLLSAAGLFGLQSYVVAQRRREIGIRMALGAAEHRVRREVIGRGLVLTAFGTVLGITVSLVSAGLIENMLFRIPARDFLSFAIVPVILFAVALTASAVPALRASRVRPVDALRQE
jgi:ABC-type antimicrobial peptide transport system permease subunit